MKCLLDTRVVLITFFLSQLALFTTKYIIYNKSHETFTLFLQLFFSTRETYIFPAHWIPLLYCS